jgi:hypothetical protein
MEEKKSLKIPKNFGCNFCDYYTSNKKDYDKHLLTSKHKKNRNGSIKEVKEVNKSQIFDCICGKICKTHSGMWKHKQKCVSVQITNTEMTNKQTNDSEDLINYLMKENTEFKQLLIEQNNQMIELAKNSSNYSINNNSHNKTFNLQFFLNETCKDAMNIMDFVDSVKLQLSDFENMGKIGYVDGISNIIVKNLKKLDVTLRPVHCSDSKREVMYVKDEDKWEKENENKQKIRKAIKQIAHKNSKMLNEFKIKHPDCDKSDSRFSDQYNKLVIEAMGGKGDNDLEKEDKIIRNIAKEVTIDKNIE